MTWKHPLAERLDRKTILPLVVALSLFTFFFLSLSYYQADVRNLVAGRLLPSESVAVATAFSDQTDNTLNESPNMLSDETPETFSNLSGTIGGLDNGKITSTKMSGPRLAVCLVGGARMFELTGPSLLDRVVNVFNNSDLFLNSPLDKNSYKLSLLKGAQRIAAVRIVEQKPVPETDIQKQVLDSFGSPNGIQGLLHYFNLVEGCLRMIDDYQTEKQIQYDWIVRTRLDGYWSSPLTPNFFVPGTYVVPTGSAYVGLNDRFGAGDLKTSRTALSRISLIPRLFAAGYRKLNSEKAFKLQLVTQRVQFQEIQVPFCVLSERRFLYPPSRWRVPVASITSGGPLGGAYCRPCRPACTGKCASDILAQMDQHFNWIDGDPDLCNPQRAWEKGWENVFDRVAGENYSKVRKRVRSMNLDQCIVDLEEMRSRTFIWDAPSPSMICKIGLERSR